MNFLPRKRVAASSVFLQLLEELTQNEPRDCCWRKQPTEKLSLTIIHLVKTGKTIIHYHEEFEHTQSK